MCVHTWPEKKKETDSLSLQSFIKWPAAPKLSVDEVEVVEVVVVVWGG